MAGHSKWAKIKHKKAINDAKKGNIFSRLAQQITLAARDGGGDPDVNFTLRLLLDKARSEGLPATNIQRAIDRGTGKSGEGLIESVSYEARGPEGVALIIDTLTDNKNRTVANLRNFITGIGGSMSDSGSVAWNFHKNGLVVVKAAKWKEAEKFGQDKTQESVDPEGMMLEFMEIEGVQDLEVVAGDEGELAEVHVITDPASLGQVRDEIRGRDYVLDSAEMIQIPNNPLDLSEEQLERVASFVEQVEDAEDVQNVWTDAKI